MKFYRFIYKYNNSTIHPGSPFKCPVMDQAKVKVEGEGLGHVAANRQTSFDIKLGQPGTQIDERDLSVKIYGCCSCLCLFS